MHNSVYSNKHIVICVYIYMYKKSFLIMVQPHRMEQNRTLHDPILYDKNGCVTTFGSTPRYL